MELSRIKALIVGHAVGDALGVPVEFVSREELAKNPVREMRGFGSHNVPPGTWSDDTSMTLCLLESLSRLKAIDYLDIMKNFVRWIKNAEFTATGVVFDVGIATHKSVERFLRGTPPLSCGGSASQNQTHYFRNFAFGNLLLRKKIIRFRCLVGGAQNFFPDSCPPAKSNCLRHLYAYRREFV